MPYALAVDSKEKTGAPENEIEVTPEMIEAGAAVLCGFETETADESFWAKEVFLAMAMESPYRNLFKLARWNKADVCLRHLRATEGIAEGLL
jgi:hypothetical protein